MSNFGLRRIKINFLHKLLPIKQQIWQNINEQFDQTVGEKGSSDELREKIDKVKILRV